MDIRGKRVVVIGFGRSGQAVTRLLLVKGAEVVVSDTRRREELPPSLVSSMEIQGVTFETGGHKPETMSKADLVVVSPGVPRDVYLPALRNGIPVIGELELAFRFLTLEERRKVIAITGTNGKTTTTAMISEVLKIAGFKVFTGGNYGIPLSELILSGARVDRIVLEVSSFQLETVETFSPWIGILLNITPDHLDRYSSIGEYAYYKYRLFERQGEGDYSILPYGEPYYQKFAGMVKGRIHFFSGERVEGVSAFVEGDQIVLNFIEEEKYSLTSFKLLGFHNRLNLASALLAGRLAGASREACERLISEFVGFPHRLEYVGTFGGVTFVNDSKATNVDATYQALKGQTGPIILLLGGRHKGGSYEVLRKPIREKVKTLILFGEAREIIWNELGGLVETYIVEDLPQALSVVFQVASPGDVVLLSPACSSFDQFRDYQERGEVFRELVLKYAPKYLVEARKEEIFH